MLLSPTDPGRSVGAVAAVVELSDGGVHQVDRVILRAPGDEAHSGQEKHVHRNLLDRTPHSLLVDALMSRPGQPPGAGGQGHGHRLQVICHHIAFVTRGAQSGSTGLL